MWEGIQYSSWNIIGGVAVMVAYLLLSYFMEKYDRKRGIIGAQWHHKYAEEGEEPSKMNDS